MPTTSYASDYLYPLTFLHTDYDNYVISYACGDNMEWAGLFGMHFIYWNILGRDTTMDADAYAAAEAKIYELVPGTDINWFTKHNTEHWWCNYNWDLA